MPDKFKALASVGAWVLFISSLWGLAGTWITISVSKAQAPGSETPINTVIEFLAAAVCVTLSVVIMRLRQKME